MGAAHLKAEEFENEVLKAETLVLVDFYAEWCGPCKMISPIVDQLADELQGKAKIVKVNVDEAQEIASQYNVMSIPNILLFKGGEVIEQMAGAMPKEQLLEKINANL